MGSCQEVLQLLTEYLEGDLTPEEQAEFERHMEGCSPCRAFLHTYAKAGALSRAALREADIPTELQERVRVFLRARLGFAEK